MQYKKQKINEILEKLFSLHRFGIKPGLSRTEKLLKYGGNPHKKFPSIHIAGTNGKGSVASMLVSILKEAGYKTGLYTSPHLIRFNERIRINGIEITDEELVELAEKYLSTSNKWGCTFFEITTAIAFDYFANNNVDIAIIEAGMGGKNDSTNIINPILSIITSISLEHQEYLGDTLLKIAADKSGIIKRKVPVIVSDNNIHLKSLFEMVAKKKETQIFFSQEECRINNINTSTELIPTLSIQTEKTSYNNIQLNVVGIHQVQNLTAVLSAIEILKNNYRLPKNTVVKGLASIKENTGYRARIEVLKEEPIIIIDSGHNPSAIDSLINTLEQCGSNEQKWNIVFAAMADKDVETILKLYKPICKELIITKPKIDRAKGIGEMKQLANKIGLINTVSFPSVKKAIVYALEKKEPTLISGSFYLAGEALPILENMLEEK